MRQVAWLYTVPEGQKVPRHKVRATVLPPISAGQHLLEILFEAGPTTVVGMGGLGAISELDVLAWQLNHGESLTSWEVSTIRKLSAEYAAMGMEARERTCAPPYAPVSPSDMTDQQRQRISDAMEDWADKLTGQRSRKKQG